MIDINEQRLIVAEFRSAGQPMTIQASQMKELLDRLEAAEKERDDLRRLHAENTTLQQGYDAARLEIESLNERIAMLAAFLRHDAAPQPTQPQDTREPLTPEQIERDRPMLVEPAAFAAGVRYAEKHHDIKGGQHVE